MIEKVCNRKPIDSTPDQIKMVAYDSSMVKARGLDTDKENIQINKPLKKKPRKTFAEEKPINEFNDFENRQPFQAITDKVGKKQNVL